MCRSFHSITSSLFFPGNNSNKNRGENSFEMNGLESTCTATWKTTGWEKKGGGRSRQATTAADFIFGNCSLYCKRMIRISFRSIEMQQPGAHVLFSRSLTLSTSISFLPKILTCIQIRIQKYGLSLPVYAYTTHCMPGLFAFYEKSLSISYSYVPDLSIEHKFPHSFPHNLFLIHISSSTFYISLSQVCCAILLSGIT